MLKYFKRSYSSAVNPSILGLCNPLIDLTLEVHEKRYLDLYDIRAGNAILAEKPIHRKLIDDVWKQHKEIKNVTVAPGGSGLNTIRAANVSILILIGGSI